MTEGEKADGLLSARRFYRDRCSTDSSLTGVARRATHTTLTKLPRPCRIRLDQNSTHVLNRRRRQMNRAANPEAANAMLGGSGTEM